MLDHLLDQLLLVHALVHLACAVWTLVTYPSPETAQTCKRAISFPASLPVTLRTSGKATYTLGRINVRQCTTLQWMASWSRWKGWPKVGSAGSKRIGKKELEMRLLYIVTKGMGDPTLASVPLHIAANGSLDIGQEVSVVLAGDATDLVIEDNMQRLEGVGVPPARELLGKLKEHEVPVYV